MIFRRVRRSFFQTIEMPDGKALCTTVLMRSLGRSRPGVRTNHNGLCIFPGFRILSFVMEGLRVTRFSIPLLLLVALCSGCSIRSKECGILFDKLRGQGPVLIDHANDSAASTQFFRDTWQSSQTVKHLVLSQGTPEAISVEREFLQPNRLKFFYPTAGEVYILDSREGEWFVAGSEPLATPERELLDRQRARIIESPVSATVPVVPVSNSRAGL
jgi:hypothetical protein